MPAAPPLACQFRSIEGWLKCACRLMFGQPTLARKACTRGHTWRLQSCTTVNRWAWHESHAEQQAFCSLHAHCRLMVLSRGYQAGCNNRPAAKPALLTVCPTDHPPARCSASTPRDQASRPPLHSTACYANVPACPPAHLAARPSGRLPTCPPGCLPICSPPHAARQALGSPQKAPQTLPRHTTARQR